MEKVDREYPQFYRAWGLGGKNTNRPDLSPGIHRRHSGIGLRRCGFCIGIRPERTRF